MSNIQHTRSSIPKWSHCSTLACEFSRLGPNENIWSVLKQDVEKREVKKEYLMRVVEEEWNRLDMNLVRKTIGSMKNRIEQVISRGGLKCDY